MDQSKKTMRHFYCRDVLWETFEQMANDFDCSIDYLVNEAMRYYARSKNYQSPGGPATQGPQPNGNGGPNQSGPQNFPNSNGGGKPPMPGRNPGATQQPMMGAGASGANGSTAAQSQRRPAPPTPGYNGPQSARAGANTSAPPPPMQNHNSPAPAPLPVNGGGPAMGAAGPTLFLIYNGQRYPVTKDQFIIGRGSKTSDLPIKDGNISRKHAAVIRRNGTFYIKDLGSTNGIDYKGMRIDNKRIDEGDVFHLCDYELRFTYRADG
ncbi:MAG: FHA domain-containing protein [Kofleriaceae bacterium]